jgi:hypothetical protein
VELTASTIQIALLFLPGLLWTMMDAAHRPPKQTQQFIYLVRTFLFGVISYAVVGLLYSRTGRTFDLLDLSARQWKFASSLDELGWALVAAFALSIVWVAGRTHKVVTRLLNYLRISNYIADQDIWEFMFNSDTPRIKFAHIRDYENELIYTGYVRAYSQSAEVRELAMYEVVVYDDKGSELYTAPYVYLSRAPSSITLEFPVAETENEQSEKRRIGPWRLKAGRWLEAIGKRLSKE